MAKKKKSSTKKAFVGMRKELSFLLSCGTTFSLTELGKDSESNYDGDAGNFKILGVNEGDTVTKKDLAAISAGLIELLK